MKADIVCTQETRDAETADKWVGNYRYISNGAQRTQDNPNEKGTGGVAITVKRNWCGNIENVTRSSHRNMQISINAGQEKKWCTS